MTEPTSEERERATTIANGVVAGKTALWPDALELARCYLWAEERITELEADDDELRAGIDKTQTDMHAIFQEMQTRLTAERDKVAKLRDAAITARGMLTDDYFENWEEAIEALEEGLEETK